MANFKVYSKMKSTGEEKVFFYDNMTSVLKAEDGTEIYNPVIREKNKNRQWEVAKVTSPENPLGKTKKIKTLKIQLGLSCNYSCEYCSQRFIPHSDESN